MYSTPSDIQIVVEGNTLPRVWNVEVARAIVARDNAERRFARMIDAALYNESISPF